MTNETIKESVLNEVRLREIVESVLVPLLPGSELEPSAVPSNSRDAEVALLNNNRLAIKLDRGDKSRLILNRSQYFEDSDKRLAKEFLKRFRVVAEFHGRPFFGTLIRDLPSRIVASVSGGPMRKPLGSALRLLEKWATITYEGQKIVASIGFDPALDDDTRPTLLELSTEDYLPVLSNGVDTMLVCDRHGRLVDLEALPLAGSVPPFAPHRMRHLAAWSQTGRVTAMMNRQGEICVFRAKSLRFARRSGEWKRFSPKPIRSRMRLRDKDLSRAIYESCLDSSFARTGACIGIVRSGSKSAALDIIDDSDKLASASTLKSRLLAPVVGEKFQNLDRRIRLELSAMDGAIILDHKGHLITAGAIVQISGRSSGGGRRAAAEALAEFGLGIKVSEDGQITGFSLDRSSEVETRFVLG